MNSIKSYISRQFGNPSGFGGLLSTFVMNRMNGKQYQTVLDNINIQPSDTILDIGFGNGYLIKRLLKQNPKKICGIEISQDMLTKVCRENQSVISAGRLDLRLADIKKIPFEEEHFDKICTVNTLYFWSDIERSFSEIRRTLKPKGIFLNAIYTKEYLDKIPYTKVGFSKYTIEEVKEMTERNGLKVIRIMEIEPRVSFCIVAEKPIVCNSQ